MTNGCNETIRAIEERLDEIEAAGDRQQVGEHVSAVRLYLTSLTSAAATSDAAPLPSVATGPRLPAWVVDSASARRMAEASVAAAGLLVDAVAFYDEDRAALADFGLDGVVDELIGFGKLSAQRWVEAARFSDAEIEHRLRDVSA